MPALALASPPSPPHPRSSRLDPAPPSATPSPTQEIPGDGRSAIETILQADSEREWLLRVEEVLVDGDDSVEAQMGITLNEVSRQPHARECRGGGGVGPVRPLWGRGERALLPHTASFRHQPPSALNPPPHHLPHHHHEH